MDKTKHYLHTIITELSQKQKFYVQYFTEKAIFTENVLIIFFYFLIENVYRVFFSTCKCYFFYRKYMYNINYYYYYTAGNAQSVNHSEAIHSRRSVIRPT